MSGEELVSDAGRGSLFSVKNLLAQGVSADSVGVGGSALKKASQGGHTDVAEALLAARANVNATDPAHGTPVKGGRFGEHAADLVDAASALWVPNLVLPPKLWVSNLVFPSKLWVPNLVFPSKLWVPNLVFPSKLWVPNLVSGMLAVNLVRGPAAMGLPVQSDSPMGDSVGQILVEYFQEGSDIPSPKANLAQDWHSWSLPELESWLSVHRPDHKLPKQNREKEPTTGKYKTTWKEQLLNEVWELKKLQIEAPGIGEVRQREGNHLYFAELADDADQRNTWTSTDAARAMDTSINPITASLIGGSHIASCLAIATIARLARLARPVHQAAAPLPGGVS
eukprot:g66915.t1